MYIIDIHALNIHQSRICWAKREFTNHILTHHYKKDGSKFIWTNQVHFWKTILSLRKQKLSRLFIFVLLSQGGKGNLCGLSLEVVAFEKLIHHLIFHKRQRSRLKKNLYLSSFLACMSWFFFFLHVWCLVASSSSYFFFQNGIIGRITPNMSFWSEIYV